MNCICTEVDNVEYDQVLSREIKLPISIESIIDKSFCVSIQLDMDEDLMDTSLNQNEILRGLRNKMGMYHLWIKQDYCGDHFMHRMLCAYVGKGQAKLRIKDHIKTKWVNDEIMYVTFFKCSNRIAKYLEQLFLDLYDFHLNSNEKSGATYLQTLWEEERLLNGTEIHEHANLSAKKYPEIFNP